MNKFKSGIINVGGINKKVVVINHKQEQKESEQKAVSCLHHIHILDRSGSMSGSIGELIENVKQTIDYMAAEDFVSVIWFSSAGQYKTLIKGARKDDSIKVLLDSIKSTLGCTCFSDPLREVSDIIEELAPICPNFNVTLFTDGEPVCPWSDREEEVKIHKAIDLYADKVIAINTVGYGNYYNKELLTGISQRSEFGQMIHSSQISEYQQIFSHNYERIKDLVVDPVDIVAKDSQIIYIGTNNSKLANDSIHFNMLEKKKNQFAIIGPDEKDFSFEYQGEVYNSNDGEKIPFTTEANILYSLAYQTYYIGHRDICLDIMSKNLKDKAFVDMHMSAFTKDEVAKYLKELRKAVFKPKYRLANGECPDNYLPAEDATCVFDVLRYLCDSNAEYVYSSNYNRIGRKSEDSFNLFKWDDKVHSTKMSELVLNDKELNVSLRSKITGVVSLNPKSASKVGLPSQLNAYTYRNQTIIKDGYLNMETIQVLLTNETLNEFKQKFPEVNIQSLANIDDKVMICIDFTTIPVINKMYSNVNTQAKYVLDNLYESNVIALKLKVVDQYLKDNQTFEEYTEEQLEVLKEHGLDKTLCYGGVNVVTADKNEDDFYMARQMEFAVKGLASLPSFNAAKKKIDDDKKLNAYDVIIKDEISLIENDLAGKDDKDKIKYLLSLKSKYKKEVRNTKMDLCIGKIATVLTGGWIKGVVMEDNDKYSYTDPNGDKTLLVTAKRIKKYL